MLYLNATKYVEITFNSSENDEIEFYADADFPSNTFE